MMIILFWTFLATVKSKRMNLSKVEQHFFNKSGQGEWSSRLPYILADNFPELGFMTALRFLEWVSTHPEGVISLPTGKTPEYFIRWTHRILENWGSKENDRLLKENGLSLRRKPDLGALHFVQMDDFYPIHHKQHNSFLHYVNEFYIKGMGLDPEHALLINSDEMPVMYKQVFPDLSIDLSLRYREPKSKLEEAQQGAIFAIDNWCLDYEEQIRQKGGIGFWLGGLGPDGHVAFNMRGSNHHSTTRLTETNYETQAAAAGDLGGIEVSRNRLVVTIGLGTITYNPDVVALIFAAGEAKAQVIKNALEMPPDVKYPATVLQSLKNARFYLTDGAAKLLQDEEHKIFSSGDWGVDKDIRALLKYCTDEDVYSHRIEESFQLSVISHQQEKEKGKKGEKSSVISHQQEKERGKEKGRRKTEFSVSSVVGEVEGRLARGLVKVTDKTILHTGPHHDDIMLGIMPLVNRQVREASNRVHFAVMTSGFTAISNRFLMDSLVHTLKLIDDGEVMMIRYPDFFETGFLYKWDKDVNHYLNKIAERDEAGKRRGLSHRIIRCMVRVYKMETVQELRTRIREVIKTLLEYYDGEKNSPDIQLLKGMLREFEEELVWAHSGKLIKDIHHLRLGFYQGDIFTEQPERERDVKPILKLLRKVNPDIISVTMDPEGSGPDTHFKVLQATARALRLWSKEKDLSELKIIGYRNVWYRYHLAEANIYIPVSLNSMAVLQNSFRQCYLSQVDASFPSPEMNAPFCDLAQKMWVDQFKEVQLLLGKDFFYQNELPTLRATHGLVLIRELGLEEFLLEADALERALKG